MKTNFPFYIISLLIFLGACESFESNLTIPPFQEFALGEFEEGAFEVSLLNQSNQTITVQTRNKAGEVTSSFGLSGKSKITVPAGETAVLVNPHAEEVRLKATLTQGVEGMNYSLIDPDLLEEASVSVNMEELTPMTSMDWKGKLVYKDYQSGEKVSIPCNLEVMPSGETGLEFRYLYPDEPHANDTSIIVLGSGGKMLGDQQVVEKGEKDGFYYVKTFKKGQDDNKTVALYFTYSFNDEVFRMKKEYQGLGSDALKFRNEYIFSK